MYSKKASLHINGTDGKRTLQRGPFWGHNSPDVKNPKWRNPNHRPFVIHFRYYNTDFRKCVDSRLCCREKIPEDSNVGEARAKSRWFSGILRTAYRIFSCKQKVPMESVHFEGVPLRIETHQISTIPNGKPQTHKNFRGPEICFIAPIQRRNIAEFNGRPTVIFQIRAKVDIARKSLRGTDVSNWRSSSIKLCSYFCVRFS